MGQPARRSDAVVRPLSRAAGRRCARPGCPAPAHATLTFAYDARQARLAALADQPGPESYDLCRDHAARTRPPHGWALHDERPDEPDHATPGPDELGSDRTVAVLAAALRGGTPAAADDADLLAEAESAREIEFPEPMFEPGPEADVADPVVGRPVPGARRD